MTTHAHNGTSRSVLVIGIDPGLDGGIAVLDGSGAIVGLGVMPVLAGKRREVDAGELASRLYRVESVIGPPTLAIVERVHAMPRQGVASSFAFGTGYGLVLGVLAARPPLGRSAEADWYDLVEGNWPVVRATLDDLLTGPPDPRALRLGAELLWFGYYRTRVHEVEDGLGGVAHLRKGAGRSVSRNERRHSLQIQSANLSTCCHPRPTENSPRQHRAGNV